MLYYSISKVYTCFFGVYNKPEPTILLNLPITLSIVSQNFTYYSQNLLIVILFLMCLKLSITW